MRLSSKLLSAVLNHRPFYVTTPIFYVNAAPHLGHVYSAVVADAVQRFEKLIDSNINVIFSTGTDEHGTKVQMAASKANLPPSKYCDKVAEQYRSLFKDFNVEFTDFIRTTEERHTKTVHHFWNELKKNDHIYKAEYSGWYSVNDEMFVPESQIKEEERNGEKVKVSQESGHTVEWTQETNYMFRLSSFRSDLQNWLKEDGVVTPSKFQKLLQDWLQDDYLPDISVSRPSSRVHWAIRVPDDEEQSVYVWLDALVNYLTVTGYPDKELTNLRGRLWPADVQVVGKDILKFHGIYWPAFLMAVGMYPPRRLLCHSHWTVDGKKMSKSLGNVVDPRNTPGGLEALRYFLLREGTMHSDANFSEVKLVRTLNAELADSFGNLLQRCTGKALNPRQEFPQLYSDEFRQLLNDEIAQRLLTMVEELPEICFQHYSNYQFYKVTDAVRAVLHAANLFFETQKPWLLKNNPEAQKELDVILHITMETIRVCATILQPIIPNMSEKLLNKLDVPKDCRQWVNSEQITWTSGLIYETKRIQAENIVLFPRIYMEKEAPRLPKQKKATV